ncbi:hypothetical protein [Ferrovibrio sp.]|uniref:hypothetical protein n=1 Tax=Ferrovibrio sp. TaxID=1917215 RepID=UPI00311ED008
MSRRPTVIRETVQAGVYQRAMLDATAIDMAERRGWLGKSGTDEAGWRVEAALWLRRAYEMAGLRQRESGSYQTRTEGVPEISEVEAWNQKAFHEAARVIGAEHWPLVRRFAIEDMLPPPVAREHLCHHLDRLACHRGLVPHGHRDYARLSASVTREKEGVL